VIASEYIRDGNLQGALESLQDEVRAAPSESKHRIFLFQLLCVMGQWDRALTQLNVAGEMDPANIAMQATYRELLQCEALRAAVFDGSRTPLVFGEPEEWIALLVEALRLDGAGEFQKAQALREQAFEGAPATSGTVNGEPFEWISDADSRIGPFLEAVINGNYYWVPFHRIARIEFQEPEDLRDFVWTPAHFQWANGGEAVGLIPTRYVGTEDQADDALRLARKTEWSEFADGVYAGAGQRVLTTDSNEYGLLDLRLVLLQSAVDADSDADSA